MHSSNTRNTWLNELIFALYLGNLAISKYFISILAIDSFSALFIPTITLLITSLLLNIRVKVVSKRPLIIALTTTMLLLFSAALFYNDTVATYMYNFLIYGLLPLYFLSRITSLGTFFRYFAYVSVVTVLLFGLDPLSGYLMTTDYMVYGYYVMLPAFIALYIARKYLGIWWLIIFEIVAFILILVFANRGAALAALSLIVLSSLFVDRQTARRWLLFTAAGAVSVVALLNLTTLLEWGIDIARDAGQSSYALEKMYASLDESTGSLSGRDTLWDGATAMFLSSPITGHGIAAFEQSQGIYTHNLILEVAVSFGLLGLMALAGYITYLLYKMLKTTRPERLSYVLGISAGIVPLMFSMQPFIWYFFWLFTLNPTQIINTASDRLRLSRRRTRNE